MIWGGTDTGDYLLTFTLPIDVLQGVSYILGEYITPTRCLASVFSLRRNHLIVTTRVITTLC